ncbi:hypothetical protein QCD58_002515 [Enterobacter hormaechei]|uniref:Uncharacterized protein n=2 Tax=Serratia marcescens TaxID=615 RepID=A0A9X8VJL1_SERMA|nr:hypothetical protein [Enterobacter hormaechei]MBS3894839.1 hypothetical protein [Serratia marcescens]
MINLMIVIIGLLAMVFAIASFITSVLNQKRFREICVLYKEKYGSLPDAVVLFEDVNSFYVKGAYSIKMQFIFIPLLWNRSSILSKNDDKDFIRGLPVKLIRPFYIELHLGTVFLVLIITDLVLMFAQEYHCL